MSQFNLFTYFKKVSSLILFLLWNIFLSAAMEVHSQDLNSLELRYSILNNSLTKQKQTLDSLKTILNERVKLIDNEKNKSNPDNDKIIELMSKSVILTNQINNLQFKVNKEEIEFESSKKQLSRIYSAIIDSIKLLQATAKNSQKDELTAQVLFLTEKKLLASPKVATLTFNPEQVIKIDLKATSDPNQRKIYAEYLQSALKEVDNQIQQITERSEELKQITQLQKKAARFIEETDFDGNVRFFNYRTNIDRSPLGNILATEYSDSENILFSQFSSYSSMLDQLKLYGTSSYKSKWNDEQKTKLSLNEYLSLLNELKKNLQEYKLVLYNKLLPGK